MRRQPIPLLILVLLASQISLVFAATLCSLPLNRLAQRAERIVALSIENIEIETLNGQPFTRAQAKVSRTYKGPNDATLALRVPGGAVGGFTMIVPGSPQLEIGARFLAFLETDDTEGFARPALRPIGLGQGLFALIEKNDRTYAVQCLSQAPRKFADCRQAPQDCLARLGVPAAELSDFTAQLRAALAQGER